MIRADRPDHFGTRASTTRRPHCKVILRGPDAGIEPGVLLPILLAELSLALWLLLKSIAFKAQ